MDLAIEVRKLCKAYDDVPVVDNLSLQVGTGEVFGLLGPNGAGKTTTVEILEGLRPSDSGDVRVLGEDPYAFRRAWRNRTGIVPQSTGAFDDLTVRETIAHFGSLYSSPLVTGDVLEMIDLAEKANTLCSSLSGGQRRRVDFGVALVGDPDLVFLDEPTTGLDPGARRALWKVVEGLAARNKTVLLTTHYLDEAEHLSDRVAIMMKGSLIAMGPPSEIGGVSGASVVSWNIPQTVEPDSIVSTMRALEQDVTVDGAHIEVRSKSPTQVLRKLTAWAQAHGIAEIPEIQVVRPSLEDAYLKMIHNVDQAEVDHDD